MKKGTILIIVGWIFVVFLIIANVLKNPNSFITNGTIIMGWLLFILQLTWAYSEKFYMYTKNIWYSIKNPECIWNMQIEYSGNFNEDVFEKINKTFVEFAGEDKCKITEISNQRRTYKIKTITYEIVILPTIIRVSIDDLEVSFRRSKKIIQKEVGILFEELSKTIKEDESDYYLNIEFGNGNPYFGFFLKRLKIEDIKAFNIKFNIEKENITIKKNNIEVHTHSLQQLKNFSEKYLTISPR